MCLVDELIITYHGTAQSIVGSIRTARQRSKGRRELGLFLCRHACIRVQEQPYRLTCALRACPLAPTPHHLPEEKQVHVMLLQVKTGRVCVCVRRELVYSVRDILEISIHLLFYTVLIKFAKLSSLQDAAASWRKLNCCLCSHLQFRVL